MTAGESLQTAVAALEASGAHSVNPVRFRYIKAMAERSLQQRGAVADLLTRKAQAALQDYEAELSRAVAEAQSLVTQVVSAQPEAAARVKTLFDAWDFTAVKRLAAHCRPSAQTGGLAALVHALNEGPATAVGTPCHQGLEEALRNQETEALRACARTTADPTAAPGPATTELRAARDFRHTRQRRDADQRVSRAVQEAPADSGPLNPQKLAISSLAALRDLSPAYMARFVSYVDTLFWLESSSETR